MDITVPFIDLATPHQALREPLLRAVEACLVGGDFVLGEALRSFESALQPLTGSAHVVGVNSGTDALVLALQACGIGPGDEVITPPNSFWATAAAIDRVGARPVFVDVREDLNIDPALIEAAINERTRALLVVHLTGRPCEMDQIVAIAETHRLSLIEDCAQAFGATYGAQPVGSFGEAGCFSFHPLKPLGGCGDGGAVTTGCAEIHAFLLKMRNHGLADRGRVEFWGANSRLDSMQAALLQVKLAHQASWADRRRAIAKQYQQGLGALVGVPVERQAEHAVCQTFIIRTPRRDALREQLTRCGVDTRVHYPVPIHLQPAAAGLGYQRGQFPVAEQLADEMISLPIYAELTDVQVAQVIDSIQEFFDNDR